MLLVVACPALMRFLTVIVILFLSGCAQEKPEAPEAAVAPQYIEVSKRSGVLYPDRKAVQHIRQGGSGSVTSGVLSNNEEDATGSRENQSDSRVGATDDSEQEEREP